MKIMGIDTSKGEENDLCGIVLLEMKNGVW